MANLSNGELRTLLRVVAETPEEEMGCDDALALFAAFAEHIARGEPLPPELHRLLAHLRDCPECAEEYEALRVALTVG
jgi:hypothetical protein